MKRFNIPKDILTPVISVHQDLTFLAMCFRKALASTVCVMQEQAIVRRVDAPTSQERLAQLLQKA